MDKERLEPNSPQEEAMWRAQVLRRTMRYCVAECLKRTEEREAEGKSDE